MTPKERIKTIRLMEKLKQHPEFSGRLGVEIRLVSISAEGNKHPLRDYETI